jgi:hypothetical protein
MTRHDNTTTTAPSAITRFIDVQKNRIKEWDVTCYLRTQFHFCFGDQNLIFVLLFAAFLWRYLRTAQRHGVPLFGMTWEIKRLWRRTLPNLTYRETYCASGSGCSLLQHKQTNR